MRKSRRSPRSPRPIADRGSPVADFLTNPIAFLRDRPLESAAGTEQELAQLRGSDEFKAFASVLGIDVERFGAQGEELESIGVLSGVAGIHDLTTKATAAFNAESLDWERDSGIPFQSYAGAQPRENIFFPLRFAWRLIHEKEGNNDGLVSIESAKWADEYFLSTLDADHLNELGWWPDIPDKEERKREEGKSLTFYSSIAKHLAPM
jgi:hypothetical protein